MQSFLGGVVGGKFEVMRHWVDAVSRIVLAIRPLHRKLDQSVSLKQSHSAIRHNAHPVPSAA